MMKWWKKLCGSHKGFTLVELICTMAIFSIIVTSVGSAMVISARSYRNGNVELDLQQQAQIASNLLTNLIIDSDKVVQTSDKRLVVEKVESGVTVSYTIYLDGGELKYFTSIDPTARTLAANISDFEISRAAGENVDFSLKVESGGRTYESDYHVTPRNGFSSDGIMPLSGDVNLFVENRLILEPCQTYDLNVRISGTTNTGFSIDTLEGINSLDTEITVVGSGINIKVGSTETDSFHFRVVSAADPTVYQTVEVLIRRVNAINVNGYRTAGTVNKVGAEYKVSALLAGTNLEREPGAWYDVDYVDPYTAQWTYEFTKEDESGIITTYPASDYISVIGQGVEGNVPYVIFKLVRNMTEGCKLRVTSTALHPEGTDPTDATLKTNKSGLKYDTVSGYWELEYQAWRRNGKIDIAIHHLGDEDMTTDWADGRPHYLREAVVKYWAYDKYGNLLLEASQPGGYNPWTSSVNSVLNAEIDGANVRDIWSLVLNVETDDGPDTYRKVPYSTPYFMTNITDRWETETPEDTGGYANRYNYGALARKDVARYVVRVEYQYTNDAGDVVWDYIEEEYAVEDVKIQYRNALASNWQRDNIIYVTELDSIVDYKVYFKFDKGWEEDDYYFSDFSRFVGIVADKPANINDIRRDIAVSGPNAPSGVLGGNTFLTFTLTAAEKAECKALTQGEGDRITVKYEYNPIFGKVNFDILDWGGSKTDLSNFKEPEWGLPYSLTQEEMDAVKGCAGSVVFCFKDPNITGATLKAMYCPTVAEYGPVYYIDDTSRFLIAAGAAQYQELEGGVWVIKHNLIWDADANVWRAV